MKITPEIKTSQDVKQALIDQGYGDHNPDILDTHPSIVKRQQQEALALERGTLRVPSAREIARVGRNALGRTVTVDTRTGVVITGNEAASIREGRELDATHR